MRSEGVGASLTVALLCLVSLHGVARAAPATKTFHVPSSGNLTRVLQDVQQYLRQNASGGYVRVELENDTFHLPGATHLVTFVNVTEIVMVGRSPAATKVICEGTTGFVFINSSKLSLYNMTLTQCSSIQVSTSRNLSAGSSDYISFSVGLYFLNCSDLTFEHVNISLSYAVGIALFNVRGNNSFFDCLFQENSSPLSVPGGGGAIVEFSYCIPGDLGCGTEQSAVVEVSNAHINFSRCHFKNNVADSSGLMTSITYPHGAEHVGFGKGGGLAVYFKGRAISNTITLTGCYIEYNSAERGGGLYIQFADESQNNQVLVSDTVIANNAIWCYALDEHDYVGGGAQVQFTYYPPNEDFWPGYQAKVTGNKVTFKRCYINSNVMCSGGGLSLVSARAAPYTPQTNSFLITNCTFYGNHAHQASALDISMQYPDNGLGEFIVPIIDQCIFQENVASSRTRTLVPSVMGYQLGMGAVYIGGVSTKFTRQNIFQDNVGTGIVITDAVLSVLENASLIMDRNSGRRGGAMVVTGEGYILSYPGTAFSFNENIAGQVGGAIYVESHFGDRSSPYKEHCFFRYFHYTLHPDYWDVNVSFSGNTAFIDSSTVFLTSLLSCVWPGGAEENLFKDIDRTLCWTGWKYDNSTETQNCSKYIKTSPAGFDNTNSYIYNMTVFPGHSAVMPINMTDDLKQLIPRVVFYVSSQNTSNAKVASSSEYVVDNTLSVYGIPNRSQSAVFYVDTMEPRVLSTLLKVTILPCSPGFYPEYDKNSCMVKECHCASSMYFRCNHSQSKAYLLPGYCMYYKHDTKEYVGHCLATVSNFKAILLPQDPQDINKNVCGPLNRKGRLCGDCREGYGVAVNHFIKCVKCNNSNSVGWLYYIIADILPITIFFITVALFKVSATSAPMNAFVFFAQIVSLPFFHIQFPWVFGLSQHCTALQVLVLLPYCMWNLEFFSRAWNGICLSPNISNLHMLLLGYLSAFYPMVLIFLSYICIELHDRNFRPIVWIWKPFRRCLIKFRSSWQPKTSIIDAFATFLMLSYTKVTIISFFLLTPTHVTTPRGVYVETLFYFDPHYNYLHGGHLPFALMAIIILLIFVLLPPVFLFLYPLQMFQRCLNKSKIPYHALHTFADAFQGCYKDRTNNNHDYRYFSGLYFLFRIIILILYISQPEPYVQFAVQQILSILAVLLFALVKPYKEAFYNKVDVMFFTLLSVMNSLSFLNFAHELQSSTLLQSVFAVNYFLCFLPLVYISGLLVYFLLKWRGVVIAKWWRLELTSQRKQYDMNSDNDESSSTQGGYFGAGVADRMINPQNYQPNLPLNSNNSAEDKDSEEVPKPARWISERSYFAKDPRRMYNNGSH